MVTKRSDGRFCKTVTINKKRTYFYSAESTVRKAERDIEKQLIEYKQKEEKGKTFKEVADEWEKIHFPTLTNNTLKGYSAGLKDAKREFSERYIKDISYMDIDRYMQDLILKKYAAKTVKNRMLVVSLIIKYAMSQSYIDRNICLGLKLPKGLKKTTREAATDEEVKIIENNIFKFKIGLLAYLITITGLRRGEACALTPADIDINEKTIKITKTVEWIGNSPHIKNSPKTEAGNRILPVTDKFCEYVKPFLNQKYIFLNEKGEPLTHGNLTRWWDELRKSAGIKSTPHQFRHWYCSQLFFMGIDVKTAQYLMGHKDLQTTLKVYTHLAETYKNQQIEKVRNHFNNGVHSTKCSE